MPRPNVLFVLADQHGHKVLGHAGHPDVKTPNLDALAAAGVRCTNAITQNPICTPSRVCWHSGQYCHNHGIYGLSGPNPGGLPTVFGHFRSHGYRTAAIGKIHCPEYWIEDDCDCFHETCGCSVGGRSRAYTEFLRAEGVEHLEDHGGFPEFGPAGRQKLDARPSGVSFAQGQEGWCAAAALDFMRECRDAGRPFFAHVSFPKPHQCYTPAKEFWDLYDEDELTLPPTADSELAGKAPHLRRTATDQRTGRAALFEPKTYEAMRRRKLHGYLGNVSHVDHAVGVLLAGLKDLDLAEDTIVIYSADHGEYATEFGILEKAPGICADCVCRIPMLWRWPGRYEGGREVTALVETVDMVGTLCTACGLPAMPTADGRDVDPLLRGEDGPVREIAVTEFAWSKSIYDGRHRLVWYPRGMFPDEHPEGFGELYDLEADPWETANRWDDPETAAVRLRLERALTDWLVTTTRPVTVLGANSGRSARDVPASHTRYTCHVQADGKIGPDVIRRVERRNYV